jgi:predicted phage tail protein
MNGAVNVQAQGNPEPLAYGEVIAGSVVVSGGMYAEDQQ